MFYEFFDPISVTHGVSVTFDEAWKKDHTFCVNHRSLAILRTIFFRAHIGNPSIFDPDRLASDEFSRENIENRSICDNGIRWDMSQGNITQDDSLFHLIGAKSCNKPAHILSFPQKRH